MRKEHEALRRGTVAIRWTTDRPRGDRDSGILAFERTTAGQTLLVVINTADDQESETCAPASAGGGCMVTSFSPGTALRDIAPGSDGATFTVQSGGVAQITVPARGGRLLIAD
jgi:hypothetical protein